MVEKCLIVVQKIQADKLRGIESDPDEVIELLDGLDQEINMLACLTEIMEECEFK